MIKENGICKLTFFTFSYKFIIWYFQYYSPIVISLVITDYTFSTWTLIYRLSRKKKKRAFTFVSLEYETFSFFEVNVSKQIVSNCYILINTNLINNKTFENIFHWKYFSSLNMSSVFIFIDHILGQF